MPNLRAVGKPILALPPQHGLVVSAYPGPEPHEDWKWGLQMCPENCVEVSTWDPNCLTWPTTGWSQTLTEGDPITGGTFSLTFGDDEQALNGIPWDITRAALQTLIRQVLASSDNPLDNAVGPTITITGGPIATAPFVITYRDPDGDWIPIVVDNADLDGTITVDGPDVAPLAPEFFPPLKSDATDNLSCYEVAPFLVETAFECASTGWETQDYEGRARRQLEAGTPKALEYELWTGALRNDGDITQPYLASLSASYFPELGADPVSASLGLAMAGQALANCAHGGRGTIHAPQTIADLWLYEGSGIVEDNGRLVTRVRRDVVIAGAGYPGTGPGGTAPAAGTAWIYVTGPVRYWLGEPFITPDKISEALDRRRNKIEYRAEREAMLAFDPCCHFAILVSTCY